MDSRDSEAKYLSEFHEAAPCQNHKPKNLHNTGFGFDYKVCGNVSGRIIGRAQSWMNSQLIYIVCVLQTIYNYRCNTVTKDTTVKDAERIHNQYLTEYQAPVYEVMKRYAVRNGVVTQNEAHSIQWQRIPNNDEQFMDFKHYLEAHSCIQLNGQTVRIYYIGQSRQNVYYVQLTDSQITQKICQFTNSLADAMVNMGGELQDAVVGLADRRSSYKFRIYPGEYNRLYCQQQNHVDYTNQFVPAPQHGPQPKAHEPKAPKPPRFTNNQNNSPFSPQRFPSLQHDRAPKHIRNQSSPQQSSQHLRIAPQAAKPYQKPNDVYQCSPPRVYHHNDPVPYVQQQGPLQSPQKSSFSENKNEYEPASTPLGPGLNIQCSKDVQFYHILDGYLEDPFVKREIRRTRKWTDNWWLKFKEHHGHFIEQMNEIAIKLQGGRWSDANKAAQTTILLVQQIYHTAFSYKYESVTVKTVEQYADYLRECFERAEQIKNYGWSMRDDLPVIIQNFVWWVVRSKFLPILRDIELQYIHITTANMKMEKKKADKDGKMNNHNKQYKAQSGSHLTETAQDDVTSTISRISRVSLKSTAKTTRSVNYDSDW